MHIPSAPSVSVSVTSFSKALAEEEERTRLYRERSASLTLSPEPAEEYDRDKWLYVPDKYDEYRYILGTRGERPLICLGVNPSTAAPGALDPTLKSVSRIAAANGFDSWMMFNVYAQRATRPDDMDKICNGTLHGENKNAFRWLLEHAGAEPALWAAWGAVIEKRDYLKQCVADFVAIGREYNAKWYAAGKISKAGHPHHPLYLKKDEKLFPFSPII